MLEPGEPEPATLPFALAFSGGGFRASLAAAGVLRFAADAGILGTVRYVSSVSGGSITHGLLAANYETLREAAFAPEGVDEFVVDRLIREISQHSFQGRLVRSAPRLALGETRAELLSRALDQQFFERRELAHLSPACRFVFNAANLSTGVRFTLEPQRLGDYVLGYARTDERDGDTPLYLADAVAASAAFPGAFCPFYLNGYGFDCNTGGEPPLVDGGVYDNLGLEALSDLPRETCIIAINAGGLFHTGFAGGIPVVGSLRRDMALLYRQSTSLRTRVLVERFKVYEAAELGNQAPPDFARRGVLFSLATTPRANPVWEAGRPPPSEEDILRLANLKTSFSKFTHSDCIALVYRGWWLAGATLSSLHPSLLPSPLPRWRDTLR